MGIHILILIYIAKCWTLQLYQAQLKLMDKKRKYSLKKQNCKKDVFTSYIQVLYHNYKFL